MRITILTVGSRGDIQPFIALSVGLKNAGHEIKFVANINFREMVTGRGLGFYPVDIDSYEFALSKTGRNWLESDTLFKLALNTKRAVQPTFDQIFKDTLIGVEDSDLLIYHSFTLPFIPYFAKHLGIPCIPVSIYPLQTRSHPALPINLKFRKNPVINLFSHKIVDTFSWLIFFQSFNKFWRHNEKVELTNPLKVFIDEQKLIFCAYSPSVIPRPIDLPKEIIITGYWFLKSEDNWEPGPKIKSFIESGPKPIFIGFGSMGNPGDNVKTLQIIQTALAKTGQRAIVGAGWGGLGEHSDLNKNIFTLQNAPFDWLFPQMSAVVHHGGAGTTAIALASGVPNVVIPHFSDNYFWGNQVANLGVGPEPIPRKKLDAKNLTLAIDVASHDEKIIKAARILGNKISNERGVQNAVDTIQQ